MVGTVGCKEILRLKLSIYSVLFLLSLCLARMIFMHPASKRPLNTNCFHLILPFFCITWLRRRMYVSYPCCELVRLVCLPDTRKSHSAGFPAYSLCFASSKPSLIFLTAPKTAPPFSLRFLARNRLDDQKPNESSRHRTRFSRTPSPRRRGTASGSSPSPAQGGGASPAAFFGKPGADGNRPLRASDTTATPVSDKDKDKAASLSQAEAEALRLKEAVEASYRPAVSAVYGMHVPLAERAARLQCLATLRLVAGGEDEASFGGGSGSGGELDDRSPIVRFRAVCSGGPYTRNRERFSVLRTTRCTMFYVVILR